MAHDLRIFNIKDYRGATVEDLDIKPAISINPTTSLGEALELAYEHEFTYLPIIHEENKKLLGILNVDDLRRDPRKFERSFLRPIVKNYMIWFNSNVKQRYEKEHQEHPLTSRTPLKTTIIKPVSSTNKTYRVITPWTSLEDLAKFFNDGSYFAIITNDHGDFVYGVATPEDLLKYENSRPKL